MILVDLNVEDYFSFAEGSNSRCLQGVKRYRDPSLRSGQGPLPSPRLQHIALGHGRDGQPLHRADQVFAHFK